MGGPSDTRSQLALPGFGAGPRLRPATQHPDTLAAAARLPDRVRLGAPTWASPGWKGSVWDRRSPVPDLRRHGLPVYCRHPLLRAVGLESAPDPDLAAVVPDGFRFVVTADERCTWAAFPDLPRFGADRGTANPRFLDPAWAADAVVAPITTTLGDRAGPIVFRFAPQATGDLGGVDGFPERLDRFLGGLPRGPLYAVELRNPALLTEAYADVLQRHGAAHGLVVVGGMPELYAQAHLARALSGPALVVRWMLHTRMTWDEARALYAPFDALAAEDLPVRCAIAHLVADAVDAGRDCYVLVHDKAEGCAPLSILRLAQQIVAAVDGNL